MVRAKSVGSGLTVTTSQAIKIPMDSTQSGTVIIINPISNVNLQNFVIDGSLLTGSAADNWGGILLEYYVASQARNITVQNFPDGSGTGSDAAAFGGFAGYGNSYDGMRCINAGRHNGAMAWSWETDLNINGVQCDNTSPSKTDTHGIGIGFSTNVNLSNLNISGMVGRCIRIVGDAYVQLSNVHVDNCSENGIFITWNSYKVKLNNVDANLDTTTSSIAVGGDDEGYIWVNGYTGNGNGVASSTFDIGLFAGFTTYGSLGYDVGTQVGSAIYNNIAPYTGMPPNSAVNLNASQSTASIGCTGTATSSAALLIGRHAPAHAPMPG